MKCISEQNISVLGVAKLFIQMTLFVGIVDFGTSIIGSPQCQADCLGNRERRKGKVYYKFTNLDLQTRYEKHLQQYVLGKWIEPVDGIRGTKGGQACGAGSIHLMKVMRPIYISYPYLVHEAIGWGKLGEDEEKARFRKVKLLRTLSDEEIDQAIDDDWARRLGQKGLFLPIAWARTATYLDRPVEKARIEQLIQGIANLCQKPSKVEWKTGDSLGSNLGDSLRSSLQDSLWSSLRSSLWSSLWSSLFYERGFVLAGQPKKELTDLLEVWQMGACPIGWGKDSFYVFDRRID